MRDDVYLLGHGPREWDRLEEQHQLWAHTLLDHLPGLHACRGGPLRVLEVGCGSGALLGDLAAWAGAGAAVVGLERDAAALAEARRRLAARGVAVTLRRGDLRNAPLGGPYDLVVARWVLSFVPEVEAACRRLADALAPGGALVVQDYDHDALGVFPRHPAVQRCIEAVRAAYAADGGDLWVAARLPGALRAAGLSVQALQPHAKAGGPGSPTWRWVERFLLEHVDTTVQGGHLGADERAAFLRAWESLRGDPDAVLFSPLQVVAVGERPR